MTMAHAAGMVCTHHHMFQNLTRCIAQDQKLFGWLKACYAGWEHLTVSGSERASKQYLHCICLCLQCTVACASGS
jgi:cytosine/adenosine deaminase-related metal-dependent hydrolase